MAIKIDYIDDWADRMAGLIYAQYKRTVTWPLMAALIAQQAQDTEDAFQTLLSLPSIDDSEGNQLTILDALVSQEPESGDDATQRLYIKARILANLSSGTTEQLYAIWRALLGQDVVMSIESIPYATFQVTIDTPITAAQAGVCADFLEDAKDAARRGIFVWQPDVDDNIFTFAIACATDTAYPAPSTTIGTIGDFSAFPASGICLIDDGTHAVQRNFTRVGATFTLSASLGFFFNSNAIVELIGDPGLGWGDDTNPDTGGEFVGAVQATD